MTHSKYKHKIKANTFISVFPMILTDTLNISTMMVEEIHMNQNQVNPGQVSQEKPEKEKMKNWHEKKVV